MSTSSKIPKQPDQTLIENALKFSELYPGAKNRIYAFGRDLGSVSLVIVEDSILAKVAESKGELIQSIQFQGYGATIVLKRPDPSGQVLDTFYDSVTVTFDNSSEQLIEAVSFVNSFYEIFNSYRKALDKSDLDVIESQRAVLESTFSRMNQQVEKLFENTVSIRNKIDEQVRVREAALQEEFLQKKIELNNSHEQRLAEIAAEKEALLNRAKDLDNSDNTAARRKIRDNLLADVTFRVERFNVSNTTRSERRPIFIALIILGLFFIFNFTISASDIYFGTKPQVNLSQPAKSEPKAETADPKLENANGITNGRPPSWFEWLHLAGSSLGIVTTLIFYVRWQNQWAQSFAKTEFDLRQFHLDVNRANWTVETFLEWRKETNVDVPPELISALTKGLFSDSAPQKAVLHPADELASALFGGASKLSMKLGDHQLEFDKPGRNIRREVETKA